MKQKHWKVSVFDKTSEIIRDDTFYTTDTEVYLDFELIDEGFNPDSATVTLYNIYGTAIISACADVVDGIVHFEMPVDAIGHLGGWRTQIVFTKDNEDYTTKIIEFDVGGHLLDNKKTPIFVVDSWNRFIKHAGNLVDDWEQLEKFRQANERKRERSESARRKTFETNEDEREKTFESNESIRHQHAEERYGQLEEEYAPKLTEVITQLAQTERHPNPKSINVTETVKSSTIISFIDDDGAEEVHSRLLPIFQEKGEKLGSAVITGFIGESGYMTEQQLLECANYGFEMLGHGHTIQGNLVDDLANYDELVYQLKTSKKWLEDRGVPVTGLVYPQSRHNLEVRKTASVYYNYAFAGNGFNDKGYIEPYAIQRIAFGSWTDGNPTINGNSEKNTLAYYKAAVDYAVDNNLWLTFMLHVNQQPLDQDVILGQLIDYIQSLDIKIATPNEGFDLKSNKISVGDIEENHLFIGKDGVKSNMMTVWEKPAGRTNNSPITAYEPGRITVIEYVGSDASGFPKSAGILETYHSTKNPTLSFQKFTNTSKVVYKRHWSGSGWSNWYAETTMTLPMNSMTSDMGIIHYPEDVVSYCLIQASAAAGYPKNAGGTLTTHRRDSTSYHYQTYKISGSSELWTRYTINNTTWSDWTLLSVPNGFEIFTIDMPTKTIPANSVVDVLLPYDKVKTNDFISGNPLSGLTTGLLYSVMVLTNGEITVRILNASNVDRTSTARTWKFQRTN